MKYGHKYSPIGTKFSVNSIVGVRLTEFGKNIYEMFQADVPEAYRIPLIELNGVYKTELWTIMQIFGPEMYMGNNSVFENNEITLEVL